MASNDYIKLSSSNVEFTDTKQSISFYLDIKDESGLANGWINFALQPEGGYKSENEEWQNTKWLNFNTSNLIEGTPQQGIYKVTYDSTKEWWGLLPTGKYQVVGITAKDVISNQQSFDKKKLKEQNAPVNFEVKLGGADQFAPKIDSINLKTKYGILQTSPPISGGKKQICRYQ